jgi:hypothetical protein
VTFAFRRHFAPALALALALTLPHGVVAAASAKPTTPAADGIAQLWVSPKDLESRDLFFGPGGRDLVPAPDVEYRFKSVDTTGHSGGYDVKDPRDRKWKVKVGDEVGSEIAVSRILWAIGYHQPVMHYVPRWHMTGGPKDSPEPGRFRLESDHKKEGDWAWEDNPFIGSQPFRGLLVVNILLNNWDLHVTNNRIYRLQSPAKGPARWYVVQDLGGSLAKTHGPVGGRNDIEGFESQAFIKEVKDDRVDFDFHGPNRGLSKDLKPADVIWACRLLKRLSERQLTDAFRAAGYDEDVQHRFVRKIRQKIDEGLALRADR